MNIFKRVGLFGLGVLTHGKLTKNYAWGVEFFSKVSEFKDQWTFLDFSCEWSKYACDHNPRFEILLILFNIKIFEFSIYNMWHLEHEQSPYFGLSEAEEDSLLVICHERRNFYNGLPISWYEFGYDVKPSQIPSRFLRVPNTVYWEFGGTHEEALSVLQFEGFEIKQGESI